MQGASAGSSGGSMKKADSVVAIVRDSLLLSAAPPRSLKVSFRDSMLPLYQFCLCKNRILSLCSYGIGCCSIVLFLQLRTNATKMGSSVLRVPLQQRSCYVLVIQLTSLPLEEVFMSVLGKVLRLLLFSYYEGARESNYRVLESRND